MIKLNKLIIVFSLIFISVGVNNSIDDEDELPDPLNTELVFEEIENNNNDKGGIL